MESTSRERRKYFRLRFPKKNDCPLLCLPDRNLLVVELAEKGMRVAAIDVGNPGTLLAGTLRFCEGREIDVQAKVLRLDRNETILHDVCGITMSDMCDEQRRLMKKYLVTEFLSPR